MKKLSITKTKGKNKNMAENTIKNVLRDAGYTTKSFPSTDNPDGKTIVAKKRERLFIIEVLPEEEFEECILRNMESTSSKTQRNFLRYILGY